MCVYTLWDVCVQLIRNKIVSTCIESLTTFCVAIDSFSSSPPPSSSVFSGGDNHCAPQCVLNLDTPTSTISLAFRTPFMPYFVQTWFHFDTHLPVYGRQCQ